MKKPTRVNHPPPVELAPDNRPVVAPIYQSVKFEFDSLEETERYLRGERPGFFYSRASNPTTRQLELLLAELQGREECLVTASGVGAVAQTLLALTKQGDHILCFVETYNPTRYLIRRLLGRFGVTHTMLSIEDLAGIERASCGSRVRPIRSRRSPISRRSRGSQRPRARSWRWTTPSRACISTASTTSTCSCTA
jgi:cystathionine beta-lyase/cystathionine gamma-synthase